MSALPDERLPEWLRPLQAAAARMRPRQLSRLLPPADGSARTAAVLVLFGEGGHGPDIVLIERAQALRSHAGQVAFPGGAVDPVDDGPVAAALREAEEETGLSPSGVQVFARLPALWVPPSNFAVTPVLGWWREPSPVSVVDPSEVAAVHRVPLSALLDPANRYSARHPSGYVGPAFEVDGLVVWGFTAGLLSRLFHYAGWERRWDAADVRDLPAHLLDVTGSARGGAGRREDQ